MKKIVDICLIIGIVLTTVILTISLINYVKNSNTYNEETLIEEMSETQLQEKNIIEIEDELIAQECDIKGSMYEVIAILEIPSLDIEYPVLSSTSKELLKISLNKYWGPNPNKKGNFCIIGHNYNDSRFLGNLYKIKIGDVIKLTDMAGKTLEYYVYDTNTVDPDNTDCTSQITNGNIEITLITCSRNFKQRFIVKAKAKEK